MRVYEYYDLSDPAERATLLKHYQSELQMTRNTLAGARKKEVFKDWVKTLEKQEQDMLDAIGILS
jgi:hypothetical protein